MTKEELIQKSYGSEVWESIDYSVKKNILSNSGGWTYEINEKWLENTKGIEIELNGKYCRPKSLKGIENNNGWVKIESEEDLPKEDGFYWVIDSESSEVFDRYFEKGNHDFFKQFSSHYHPVIKPDLPLY